VIADFSLPLKGTISGKVLDDNDEPVPGVEVVLIVREYGSGALRYFRRTVAYTNDKGAYRMESVRPGIPYLLLFRKADHRKMNPVSDAPTEPKLRRPAVKLILSFGLGPQGGTTGLPPSGESGADGQIRICDLHPGDYRLTAFTGDLNGPESMSTIPVSIRDRDVREVTLQPTSRLQVPVEFVWSAEPPEKAVGDKPSVSLISTTRSFGGFAGSKPEAMPGKSQIGGLGAGLLWTITICGFPV
jgi:hypothetical protein